MQPDISIEVKNLEKSFVIHHERKTSIFDYVSSFMGKKEKVDTLTVLKEVSFSVKKGEVLGILGLNGSGKTTLLKIIANIYSPDKGEVITNGKITPFLGLGVGFNGELTARDNIIIYGVILGLDKEKIKQKIDEITKFAELERFLDTKVKNFSNGMNARLAFSTAISVDPDILLVDEVLSVGDLTFQQKSFNTFLGFKKKGKTIVFVTHSLDQIQSFCDRAILLNDGKIISEGSPDSVIEAYKFLAAKK